MRVKAIVLSLAIMVSLGAALPAASQDAPVSPVVREIHAGGVVASAGPTIPQRWVMAAAYPVGYTSWYYIGCVRKIGGGWYNAARWVYYSDGSARRELGYLPFTFGFC